MYIIQFHSFEIVCVFARDRVRVCERENRRYFEVHIEKWLLIIKVSILRNYSA